MSLVLCYIVLPVIVRSYIVHTIIVLLCHTSGLMPHVNMVFLGVCYHLVVIELTIIVHIHGKKVCVTITINVHKCKFMTINSTFLYRSDLVITHIIVSSFIPSYRRLLGLFYAWLLHRFFHNNHFLRSLFYNRLSLELRGNISTIHHIFCGQRSTIFSL